jgi:hypothetical protein
MELKTNVTIRYCQAIDRFIKVRVFSDREIEHLFKNTNLTGKRSYQQLVINTSIINYNDNILKDILLLISTGSLLPWKNPPARKTSFY